MKADFERYMDENGYDYHSYDRCEDMDSLINQFAEDFAKQEAIEFYVHMMKQFGGDFYESEIITNEEAIREHNKHKQDESNT